MTQYNYALGNATTLVAGTGTLTVSLAATAVFGSSTLFETELHVGDVIVYAGYSYSIAVITDDTHLVLATESKTNSSTVAFSYSVLVNVESMTTRVPAPKSTFRPFTESQPLANGKIRGFGRPLASWRWGFITLAQRTQLRTYCGSKSTAIYVRTRTNEGDAYNTFSGTLIWPDDEDKQTGRRINFTLDFKNLVQI